MRAGPPQVCQSKALKCFVTEAEKDYLIQWCLGSGISTEFWDIEYVLTVLLAAQFLLCSPFEWKRKKCGRKNESECPDKVDLFVLSQRMTDNPLPRAVNFILSSLIASDKDYCDRSFHFNEKEREIERDLTFWSRTGDTVCLSIVCPLSSYLSSCYVLRYTDWKLLSTWLKSSDWNNLCLGFVVLVQ